MNLHVRPPSVRACLLTAAMLCWCSAVPGAEPLRFMRVHVPPEELADVPRGDARYVPMPIEEFEEALARASRGPTPIDAPLSVEAALYRAAIGSEGMLVGTVEFEIGDHGAAPGGSALNGRDLPLGGLAVTRCTARTAKGVGEAVVFGRGDGGVAIATPVPGTYECEWTAPPAIRTADGGKFSLPLVPTARSTVLLTLPAGFRPLVAGLAVAPRRISTAGGDHWEIHTGPQPHLDFVVVPEDGAPTPLAVWTDMSIRGREAALLVAVEPTVPWHEEMVVIEKDSAMDMIVDGETIEVCLMEVESLVRPVGMVQIPSAILSLTTFAAVMARHDNGACGTLQGTSFHFAKTSTAHDSSSNASRCAQMWTSS